MLNNRIDAVTGRGSEYSIYRLILYNIVYNFSFFFFNYVLANIFCVIQREYILG